MTVVDNGRGIPVGINHKAGLPAVEVVFTVLHAGGKFGSGGYKAGGILLAFELGFVKVFVGAVFFCHQFVVGACFNDFAVV